MNNNIEMKNNRGWENLVKVTQLQPKFHVNKHKISLIPSTYFLKYTFNKHILLNFF